MLPVVPVLGVVTPGPLEDELFELLVAVCGEAPEATCCTTVVNRLSALFKACKLEVELVGVEPEAITS